MFLVYIRDCYIGNAIKVSHKSLKCLECNMHMFVLPECSSDEIKSFFDDSV